jgi:hypothetical protein
MKLALQRSEDFNRDFDLPYRWYPTLSVVALLWMGSLGTLWKGKEATTP